MAAIQPTWGEVYQVPPTTTGEDLPRLPDDGSTYELYEGMLVREMTSPAHGGICQRLGFALGLYAQSTGFPNPVVQHALFDLSAPGAAIKTVLAPDVAIQRSGAPLSWGVPHETPLVAAEVVSDSQSLVELTLKAQTYRTAGVDEVWVIDHRTRSIEVWTASGRTTLNDSQMLTSPLLPGFGVPVRVLLDG